MSEANPKYKGWYYNAEVADALTESEMKYNANLAMKYLRQHDFTKWAAAGIVGNMWAESFMNPGAWQGNHYFDINAGYGLVQWTPYTDYTSLADPDDWQNNGPEEMRVLQYERENNLQFYPTTHYPQNWEQFAALEPINDETDALVVNRATAIFMYNYLRAGDPEGTLANRQYHARFVFENAPGNFTEPWLLLYMSDKKRRLIK